MGYHFAPIQGHTDHAYRYFHSELYKGAPLYYSPFIRLEKEDIRKRDEKDILADKQDGKEVIPQVIFRNQHELSSLIRIIKELGFKSIDLNMGCPFPLQTGHGRGAGAIANPEVSAAIEKTVNENPDIIFSLKMRLGFQEPDEWHTLINTLNRIDLAHVTVHPRVAKQQYKGDINFEEFQKILDASKNPIVYNGDILSPSDISETLKRFPSIAGIMVGRGLLARPSLIEEFYNDELPRVARVERMLDFHRKLFNHYSNVLCGDTQILSKIKPFWEYAENEIGKKAWKAINKSTTIAKYNTALALID